MGYGDGSRLLLIDFSAEASSIGAVLSQVQHGRETVIAYASVKLNSAQKKYSAYKGELLGALVFIKKFRYFLQLRPFILRTDSAALRYLHTMQNPSSMFVRWAETLSHYNFEVVHRLSGRHGNADSLSRIDFAQEDPENNDVPEEQTLGSLGVKEMKDKWAETMEADGSLQTVLKVLRERRDPTSEEMLAADSDSNLYLRSHKQMYIDNKGLLRMEDIFSTKSLVEKGKPKGLLVVPVDYQLPLCRAVHEMTGHRGREETVRRVRSQFYLPRTAEVVTSVINSCEVCQASASKPTPQRGLHFRQWAAYPWQSISVDYVGPLVTSKGYTYIFSCCCFFSKWYDAWPTRAADAKTTVNIITREILPRYGLVERIHSDNASHFLNRPVLEVMEAMGIAFVQSPPYSPSSNLVERAHRDLGQLLLKMSSSRPTAWVDHLPAALFVMRTSFNRSLGMSPFECLYGRRPSTSLDLLFQEPRRDPQGLPQTNKASILAAQEWVRKNVTQAVARQRRSYLGKLQKFEVNDLCWLFTPTKIGKGLKKFTQMWTGPWRVGRKINPLVYELLPHPTWLRKRTEIASIDRMKRFVPAEGENYDQHTIAPPLEADLSMNGDEFAERFGPDEDEEESYGYEAPRGGAEPPYGLRNRPLQEDPLLLPRPQRQEGPLPPAPVDAPAVLPPIPEQPLPEAEVVTPQPKRRRRATPDERAKQEADAFTKDLPSRRQPKPSTVHPPRLPVTAGHIPEPQPLNAPVPEPPDWEEENFLEDGDHSDHSEEGELLGPNSSRDGDFHGFYGPKQQ